MAKLAAWSIDGQHAEGASQQSEPKRVGRSHIGLERHLEDWIANDVTMIAEGLTLVGRQISIDDGRLDLLAIDSQDRWVVIEIKPGVLDSSTLAQRSTMPRQSRASAPMNSAGSSNPASAISATRSSCPRA